MVRGRPKNRDTGNGNGANLGFEAKLWAAADKLRGHMDAAEYKNVVLGLIFLKCVSDTFKEHHDKLKNEPYADPEDKDEVPEGEHLLGPQRGALDRRQ
ncbi:MAG: type I restriction-modification system subunit M N-terminal domain-containing protein [Methanothrix sp.]|nr:type I restriction-modification system subunit M N-terminal domain-containing protein [Methanothrix sp.]